MSCGFGMAFDVANRMHRPDGNDQVHLVPTIPSTVTFPCLSMGSRRLQAHSAIGIEAYDTQIWPRERWLL